jgi:hypothetical protein
MKLQKNSTKAFVRFELRNPAFPFQNARCRLEFTPMAVDRRLRPSTKLTTISPVQIRTLNPDNAGLAEFFENFNEGKVNPDKLVLTEQGIRNVEGSFRGFLPMPLKDSMFASAVWSLKSEGSHTLTNLHCLIVINPADAQKLDEIGAAILDSMNADPKCEIKPDNDIY